MRSTFDEQHQEEAPRQQPRRKTRQEEYEEEAPRQQPRQHRQEVEDHPRHVQQFEDSPEIVKRFSKMSLHKSPEQQTKTERSQGYPPAIVDLLQLCLQEVGDVQEAFKGRARQQFIKMFQAFGDKLSDRDYAIIRGATGYLYEYSRVRSIDEERALRMMGIHEIPASQIAHYTSKALLEKIARSMGLPVSGKKAETLVKSIRSMLPPTF